MLHPMKKAAKLLPSILILFCFVSSTSFAQTNPGEDLFRSKCTSCHGPDGTGKTTMGTMLKIRGLGSADVQKQTDADLARIITKGQKKMPAFDGKLKKEQIEQLVGFIRQLANKQ